MSKNEPEQFFQGPVYNGVEFPPFPCLKTDAHKRFEEIRKFQVRPDDVLLCTYPKSGTHWVFELLNMLINRKLEYSDDLVGNMLALVDSMSMLDKIKSPRVLLTHLPYQYIPEVHRVQGAKVVHVVRNPKDVYVSSYHHLVSTSIVQVSWSKYIDSVIDGRSKLLGGWFAYERDFEEATKNNKNARIHTIFYEDLQMTPVEELRKLAIFLDVQYDEKLLQDIINKCNFENMKMADETLKTHTQLDNVTEKIEEFQNRPKIYRKGKIGDWKNMFTVAQSERFDKILKVEMKDSQLKCLSSC